MRRARRPARSASHCCSRASARSPRCSSWRPGGRPFGVRAVALSAPRPRAPRAPRSRGLRADAHPRTLRHRRASGALDVGINANARDRERDRPQADAARARPLLRRRARRRGRGRARTRRRRRTRADPARDRGPDRADRAAARTGPRPAPRGRAEAAELRTALSPSASLGAAAFVVEGGTESWSALFLERQLHAHPAVSGLGPGVFGARWRRALLRPGRARSDRELLAGGSHSVHRLPPGRGGLERAASRSRGSRSPGRRLAERPRRLRWAGRGRATPRAPSRR